MWFNRLIHSKHRNNANAWNATYRISTERALLKNLRDWDDYAWWEIRYLGWRVRTNWDTMISLVKKLIVGDEKCLDALSQVFLLENLKLKFHELTLCRKKTPLDKIKKTSVE